MNIRSSILFSLRMIFPKTARSSIARKSLFGAVICIAISIIPLVVVLSVSNGMIEGITDRLISLSSSHLEVVPSRASAEIAEEVTSALLSVPDIQNAFPLIQFNGLSSHGKKRSGAMIRAINPEIFLNNQNYKVLFNAVDGNIADFYSDSEQAFSMFGKKRALIGEGIASRLNVKPGDSIRLITMEGEGENILPHVSAFKVCAIISCGYQELDALWVFIPFEQGKEMLKKSSGKVSVMVEVSNPFSGELGSYRRKIKKLLGSGFKVYRWDEVNRSQYENFSSTKIMLIFIMLLIVLVAAVNISSALVMLVMERRREIAILKSVGADASGITLSFLFTGFFAGFCGVFTGLPCGLFLSLNVNKIIAFFEKTINFFSNICYYCIHRNLDGFSEFHIMDSAYYLQEIPVEIPVKELSVIVIAAILLSVVVSIAPSVKAGKEKPLDTLRNAR